MPGTAEGELQPAPLLDPPRRATERLYPRTYTLDAIRTLSDNPNVWYRLSMIMKAKKPYLIIVLTVLTGLFAMDCTCLYAAAAPMAESVQPSCHGHSEKPTKSAPQKSDDCCGKCGIEKAARVATDKAGVASRETNGFYDPYLAADALAHGRGDEFIFVSLIHRDLLYDHHSNAQTLPRAPPAFLI